MNKLFALIGVIFFSTSITAQQPIKKQHFGLYLGLGPSLYYNNFEYYKEYVNPIQYATSLKILWEPEHQLSLGIYTGYRKIYSVNAEKDSSKVYTRLYAIPIQLCISMKIYKGLYTSFSFGPSILSSQITVPNIQEINTSLVSIADITTSLGYKKHIAKNIFLGGEIEYYHSSRSFENTFSLMAVVGYTIK